MYHTLNTNLENYIYYDIRVMKLKKNMNYRIRYILRNNIFLIFVFILVVLILFIIQISMSLCFKYLLYKWQRILVYSF